MEKGFLIFPEMIISTFQSTLMSLNAHEVPRNLWKRSTASRLVGGTLSLHEELEDRLALHKNYPHALLYGSGYLTSLGTIPHIVDRHDLIFADRLIHAYAGWYTPLRC